jgi:CSLREA domain-containing protein
MRPLRCLLILLIVLLPAGPFATTFPVTKTDDTDDGTCDSDCSLREAIEAANTNPGADDVPVPAGTYLLNLGRLVVSDDLSIAGAGQVNTIIDGGSADHVIRISRPAEVVAISGVTIQNGYAAPSEPFLWSSNFGGGIRSWGVDVTLTNSTVSNNRAAGIHSRGGGVHITGSGELRLINSTVSGNTSDHLGGGISIWKGELTLINSTVSDNTATASKGGGIFNQDGRLTVADSMVRGNTAARPGGGISTFEGSLTLTNSTVSGNSGGEDGGGISHRYGNLALNNSTVSDNSVFGSGGGISFTGGYYGFGDATLTNTTVSGNTAVGGYGGGILMNGYDSTYYPGTMALTNSTLTGNSAGRSGNGIFKRNAKATFTNTIVFNNGTATLTCNGAVKSLGNNITDDTSCGFTEPTDLVVADAMLGPLQDNGGPTETHDLLPGSPAIDAGSVDCPPPATDQRGVARPQGTACDIGAVEFVPEPHHTATLIAGAAFLGLLYRRRARGLRIG